MGCLLSNMRSRCRSGRVRGLEVAFYTSLTGFAAFKRHDPHGGGSGWRLAPSRGLDTGEHIAQVQQAEGRERKQEFPAHPRKPAQLHFAQPADFLPADSGFDELADLEARRVALVARGARIDGRTAGPGGVLRHMRGDVLVTQTGDEFCRVIRLVRPQGLSAFSPQRLDHLGRRLPLGTAAGRRDLSLNDKAVAVLHHQVAEVAELRLLALALTVEPAIRIGVTLMGVVATLLAAKIHLGVAP